MPALRRPVVLIGVLLLIGVAFTQPAFTDLAGSRFREAVTYLHGRDLVGGFPDGTFRPEQAMTRAEFLALVIRAAALPEPAVSGQCLAELPAGAWYAPVVCQGVALGLISGEATELRPQDTVLYSEALKMVITAFGFQTRAPEPGEAWYAPYVSFAAEQGILSALAYRPANFVTREVAAGILYGSLVLSGSSQQAGLLPEPTVEPGAAPMLPDPPDVPALPVAPQAAACRSGSLPQPPAQLQVNGSQRSLLTHLPASLQSEQPAALIVVFHGRTNSNEQVRRYMRLDGGATDSIIVYPAALLTPDGGYSWRDPGDSASQPRDLDLFDRIVERYSSDYCIDPDRIFVVGHSLGAYFANSVACLRADTVRAVASVAGGILPAACEAQVAALLFHNPNDTLVAISEGELARDVFLHTNQLTGVTPRGLSDAFNCSIYDPGHLDSSVTWCRHDIDYPYGDRYDPHSWPAQIGPYVLDYFNRFRSRPSSAVQ